MYVCGELYECVYVWCICLECTCLKINVWVYTLFPGSRDQEHVTCSSTPSTFPCRQAGSLMKPRLVTSKPCGLPLSMHQNSLLQVGAVLLEFIGESGVESVDPSLCRKVSYPPSHLLRSTKYFLTPNYVHENVNT